MKKILIVFILFGFLSAPYISFGESEAQRKKRLETELQQIETQILQQQVLVEDKQLERQSLERDLNIIDSQVKKAQLGIKARSVAISQLTNQIGDKKVVIDILVERLAKQRQSLSELMRQTQSIDDFSLVELILSNKNFSKFFEDFESFRAINSSLKDSLDVLKNIKSDTEVQKNSLEEKKLTEAELKVLQEQEKIEIERKEKAKEQILTVTKGEEKAYQELLESQQKTASELRAALFKLSGGGAAIPFPDAIAMAKVASRMTNVPTALILAILEQESSYGSNIGSCSYNDIVYGKPVMHPDRDQPVFEAIAKVVGFEPRSQQISCPWIRRGERIGWGGAMGPSQFIPSTWAIYGGIILVGNSWQYNKSEDRIRSLLGKRSPSSPFVNQDAFMATALYMKDQGAKGTYTTDWKAAIRYFSGWNGWKNPINQPYGDNVMSRKARLENEIRILGG